MVGRSTRAAGNVGWQLADNAIDIIVHLRGVEVVWISPSVENAFGWPMEHWVGKAVTRSFRPDDVELATSWLQAAEQGTAPSARCRIPTVNGEHHWIESSGKPFIDDKGNPDGLIITVRIVDEQVEAEHLLLAQKQRFEAVVANSPSAISLCDLQLRYTLVNRAFCELFGLKSAADVIGRTKDEILPPDAWASSRIATDRILAGERFFEYESISLGRENFLLATQQFPLHNAAGAITEMVTVRTDITHRRNAEQAAIERATWEERIRGAIGAQRLLVYSQPIVDTATQEPIEEELLIRLRDPATDEILLPAAFLPQCEQHGLMPVIDQYMVGCAIELAGSCRRVCVNITGQTIGTPTVMKEIVESLAAAGPDKTEKILFEITESTALGSPEVAGAFSRSMKSVGCRVALDDFGTGYGTFTELRHLDLDSVKIDQSFVKGLLAEGDDERAVNSIVLVARLYNLTTVAEGVESEAVLDRLSKLGVDRAQGYLFGRPDLSRTAHDLRQVSWRQAAHIRHEHWTTHMQAMGPTIRLSAALWRWRFGKTKPGCTGVTCPVGRPRTFEYGCRCATGLHQLTPFGQQTTFGHLCDDEQCDEIRCGSVRLLRSHPPGPSIDKLANCHGSEYYGETEKGSRP